LLILHDVPIRPRAALLWSWILCLSNKVLEEQGIPPGKQRDVGTEAVNAREAIALIWTYLGTQLPFAYVHLCTFIVNLNNIIVSIKCGVVFVAAMKAENWLHAGTQVAFLSLCPLLYQGLLSISYVIHDPFGEDMLDFPVMAFQEYANAQSVSVTHFCQLCPALKKHWGPDATLKQLALRKCVGKSHAERLARQLDLATYGVADDTDDGRAERDVALGAELKALVAEDVATKDKLFATLEKQRGLVDSELAGLNTRLQSLEAKSSQMMFAPVAPPAAGWCAVMDAPLQPTVNAPPAVAPSPFGIR